MVHQRLQELRQLKQNWDGYSAVPIDPSIIANATSFVDKYANYFCGAPRVVPMTMGRLQFEWHRGNRSLEIEFEKPESIHYLKWDSDEGIEEEDILSTSSEAAVKNVLAWFSSEKRNVDSPGRRTTSA